MEIPDNRFKMWPYEKKVNKNKLANKPDFIEFFENNVEITQNKIVVPTTINNGIIIS
tara:strand:+ start:186 stop:356 length:171 start_codon:yes stop_codon:yes gene_type:complete